MGAVVVNAISSRAESPVEAVVRSRLLEVIAAPTLPSLAVQAAALGWLDRLTNRNFPEVSRQCS